jgi:2-C-methyl-D-erythritol 4-phosphate cytidylyltransferase
VRKPFLELDGEPVLVHALRPFLADARVTSVVVALSKADAADPPTWISATDPRILIVEGGSSRAESVRNALAALPEVDVIAVHDAARPLVTEDVAARCIDIALAGEGAVAGCPAVDTVKEVDENNRIVGTPARDRLWYAHTPQVFPADVLRRAYAAGIRDATDDASVVERLGASIRMVDGGAANLKVTRAEDVPVAEALLRQRRRTAV